MPTEETTDSGGVRLIFEYEGDEVRLVAQLPVESGDISLDNSLLPGPGHYVELRDADSASLGRLAVPDAFSQTAEVFPDRPGEPITRVRTAAAGTFTAVVPATRAARRVAVVRLTESPSPTASVPGRSVALVPAEPDVTDIATFPLQLED